MRSELQKLKQLGSKKVILMTGAGMSAASGIPTFRGEEGYWTVGSKVYQPTQLATHEAFSKIPLDVWSWYLYRRTICNRAKPNLGHALISQLEKTLGERFLLVTQNVDGLHVRAGNSADRCFEVHGSINRMRCSKDCCTEVFQIPESVGDIEKGAALSAQQQELLTCPRCRALARPHILWFDECYNEEHYRFESSRAAVRGSGALITIGSSGATNLPMQMARLAISNGSMLVDINPDSNPFSGFAQSTGGVWIRATADEGLAQISAIFSGS